MKNAKIRIQNYYALVLILLFSFISIFKAYATEITVDEAFSFLNYSYVNDYLNLGLANNHLINSFLVYLIKHINYSEFALRIPNVLFGLLYYFIVFVYYKNRLRSPITLFIFLLNPYIIDFFSISRGYGISVSLIFLASHIYITRDKNYLLVPLILISLASISYHVVVVLLITFVIFNIKEIIFNETRLNSFIILSIFLIVSLLNIYILFVITSEGKPLYGLKNLTFFELLIGSLGLNALYLNKNILFNIFLNLIFLIPIFSYTYFSKKLKKLFFVTHLSLFLIYLIPFFLNKPLPLLREVVPFLPLMLYLIAESLRIYLKNKSRSAKLFLSMIFGTILIPNFINSIELTKTIDWKDGMPKSIVLERINCQYVIPYNELDSVGQYYRLLDSKLPFKNC